MQTKTREFLTKNGLTQSILARSLGVSTSAISQYLKAVYKGDVAGLEVKINDFMNNYKNKDNVKALKIVQTADLNMAHFILDECIIGNEMAIVFGKPGCGKTTTIKEFVKTHPEAILIEAIPGMQIRSVLSSICEKLGIQSLSNSEIMIVDISNEFKRRESILIIDEAENLTTKTLEAIRRIWDFSNVPTALVGTPALLTNLKGRNGELLQLYSRISGVWEFKGLTDDDFKALFNDSSNDIKAITTHLRRAVNIYKKAVRFAQMKNETINAGHIKSASSMVILG
ncbi:AAA family ATPase [Sulfurimonas sp.]|uniref:AAA family ATPase n=1 Tax=Sulfurimonas sp. TaxID=2022749 RepID=UPI0025F9DCF5|nr:AAA family ATPase [Sulfurimonas sp.]